MESLIPLVNQLQEIISLSKINIGIDLPRIIVVGSQSSGKSSVLESIVGKDFLPRGTGIVTRCPLVLRLIRTETDQDYAKFNHIDCYFEDFREVTNEIIAITNDIASSEGVSTREIFLNVYSRNVVDLTLIDLPGIIKVPLKGQAKNLDQKINKMILDYASQENSIILGISPANIDLANSDALNIARNVDPEGNRTIGVITKIDLMDRGTNALEMIEGKLYPLKLGYVGVVCRSQEDIHNNVPMQEHLLKEKEFFENSPIYSNYSQRLGIKYLSTRLNSIFKSHIQATIPAIKREISMSLEATQKELQELGVVLDTIEKKNDLLFRIINNYCRNFYESLDGKDVKRCTTELLGGSRIRNVFLEFFEDLVKKTDPLRDLSDYQIRIAIINATGSKGVMFVSELAFENLTKEIIKNFEKPSVNCLITVKEEVQRIILSLEIPEFQRFARLREALILISNELLDQCVPITEKKIQDIIEIESGFLNISHPNFINPNEAMKVASSEIETAARQPRIENNKTPEVRNKESTGFFGSWFGSNAKTEQKFEEIGSQKKINSILDEEMTEKELEQNILIKILIGSYLEIAKLNISDSVPKAIMKNFVNNFKESLPRILTNRIYGNQEFYEVYLDEDPFIKNRRKDCIDRREALSKAYEILKIVIV
jgi:replication fork clamp-binding protein CrfC